MNTQSQIEAQVRARADEDVEFRARLMKDPKKAIKEATGYLVPDGINIHVVEDNATDYHLVLPPVGRNLPDGEISGVAGGTNNYGPWGW